MGNFTLNFETIDDKSVGLLKGLIAKMNCVSSDRKERSLAEGYVVIKKGSLEEIVELIELRLRADYSENVCECADSGIGFDYVVIENKEVAGILEIMTRIYGPSGPDDSCVTYGCMIVRIGEGIFHLWGNE